MKKAIGWIVSEESAQGMVEYSLILALVAIVVIGALKVFGQSIYNLYNESASKIP